MSVKKFPFDDDVLNALEASLSPERMATYIQKAEGDRELALRFYTWNTAISAAFYGPLQGLEIALRNSMHSQLSVTYGQDWYDQLSTGLDAGALRRVEDAKRKLTKGSYPIDPPHMVAELPFGFWVSLLGRGGRSAGGGGQRMSYEMTLWRPALHKAFPHSRRNRRDTHQPLDYLRTFRNRIAHHEPIFDRHLERDFASIINVTQWICPKTADWIQHHSRVDDLLGHDRLGEGLLF